MNMAPATSEWVLRGRALGLGYGRSVLFTDVSFEVARGAIVGIVGPNGSGKTTLLRVMLGLLDPLRGEVARASDLSIGYVPQRDHIDASLPVTVLEVVLMGLTARGGALRRVGGADRQAAWDALCRLGDQTLASRLFRDLSRGQQQRVLLARALAGAPDLLVLDEPTAGMDIAGEHAMVDFLRSVNRRQRMTIVIVTHLLPLVLNLATSIMLVGKHGILHGPMDDVLQEDRLTDLYGVPVHVGTVAGRRTLVVGASDGSV